MCNLECSAAKSKFKGQLGQDIRNNHCMHECEGGRGGAICVLLITHANCCNPNT